jgi:hypothetical protein
MSAETEHPGDPVLDARLLRAMTVQQQHDYICRLEAAVLDMRREIVVLRGRLGGCDDAAVVCAAEALADEVARRNERYGLDHWTFSEVAAFVLRAAGGGP